MQSNKDQSSDSRKKKWVIGIGLLVAVLGVAGAVANFPTASNQGYQPVQPIPFSHKLHAGQYKMACQYCHVAPEISRHSTVPSGNVCMNCHKLVKLDSPYIQELKATFEAGKPMEWTRVHELPDFVYYPHKRHVNAGIACQTCHGPVETMDTLYQYSPLTMGWCLDCHRGVTTPENVKKAKLNPETGLVAPTSCSTCHQ